MDGPLSNIAIIVVCAGKRRQLLDTKILPPIIAQHPDELLVVGEHHEGSGYRYLHVPDMMKNTNDALVKRDVGTVAADADILVYLSDDHGIQWDFCSQLRTLTSAAWDVLVPSRWTQHPTLGRIEIPTGITEGYLAGHGGVFRRWVIQRRPWTSMPHDRIWDVLASREQQALGARFAVAPQLQIEDYEPEREPWK